MEVKDIFYLGYEEAKKDWVKVNAIINRVSKEIGKPGTPIDEELSLIKWCLKSLFVLHYAVFLRCQPYDNVYNITTDRKLMADLIEKLAIETDKKEMSETPDLLYDIWKIPHDITIHIINPMLYPSGDPDTTLKLSRYYDVNHQRCKVAIKKNMKLLERTLDKGLLDDERFMWTFT